MSEQPKKIFIVDDDKFLREMYVTKFSSSGFEVDGVGSVREAVEKLEEGYNPDVLIFDIVMPMEDGWDLAQQVKEKELAKEAKRVVLSNQGEETDIERGKEFDIDLYIVKAMKTPSEVVAEVTKLLE
jgi:CheY-like chemotaxis protein